MKHESETPRLWTLILAFAAVWGIWGSTYLVIRIAVVDFAPFVMASLRFLAAGAVLYVFMRLRGAPAPSRAEWVSASWIGFLLLSCSNGAVTWAEKTVPSGLTALLCAILPMWMVLLDWLGDRSKRPGARVILGVLLGIAGVAVLIGPGIVGPGESVDLFGAGLIVLGSLTWALGSLASRKAKLPSSAPMSTAMQMLAGGTILALGAALNGDWQRFHPTQVPSSAWLALAYLAVFGSLIALSAYVWLLRVSTPARVSTYAYINPVVAVILGWALLDEPLGPRTILAAGIIVTAVVVITSQRARAPAAGKPTSSPKAASEALVPTPIKR